MLQHLVTCQLCGSDKFVSLNGIIRKPDLRKADLKLSEDSTVWQCCIKCSFVFQNPRPSQKFVEDYYARSAYHTSINQEISQGQIGHSLNALVRFNAFLHLNGIRLSDFRGKTCLDFGCGIGSALNILAEAGNTVYGCELDRREQDFARANYPSIKMISTVQDVPPGIKFDFIFSHHSLEHVFDPNEFLAFASRSLAPDGTLMIVVPSWRGSPSLHYMSGFDLAHNSMFDHISLAGFMNKHGMYVYSYLYQNSGDWEVVTLSRRSPMRNHWPFSMDEVLAEFYENIPLRDGGKPNQGAVHAPLDTVVVRN